MANDYSVGPIDVEGCTFDDFLLTDYLPPQFAYSLENFPLQK